MKMEWKMLKRLLDLKLRMASNLGKEENNLGEGKIGQKSTQKP